MTSTVIEIITNVLTSVALLIGGAWSLWRFVLQREANPKVQFDVDLKIIGFHKGKYVIEVIAVVENKGLVRHSINDFYFDILYLPDGGELVEGNEKVNRQLTFEKVMRRYWIPSNWNGSFIDAGVQQHYRYVTFLSVDAKFLLLIGKFKYPDSETEFHTSQKTFAVDISMLQKDN